MATIADGLFQKQTKMIPKVSSWKGTIEDQSSPTIGSSQPPAAVSSAILWFDKAAVGVWSVNDAWAGRSMCDCSWPAACVCGYLPTQSRVFSGSAARSLACMFFHLFPHIT